MSSKPTSKSNLSIHYQRWSAILASIIIGEAALTFLVAEQSHPGTLLAPAGIPVSAVLGLASIIGIIASLIIFRTPHDGNIEF